LPWVTFDQVRHRASIAFYSSEEDPSNRMMRFSCADFDSVSTVHPLGLNAFNPLSLTKNGAAFIGDYVGADAYNGYYAAAWTENRKGHNDGDVFAYIRSPNGTTRSVEPINQLSYSIGDAYPQPSLAGNVSFNVTTSEPKRCTVTVYDLLGNRMTSLETMLEPGNESLSLPFSQLAPACYHVVFNCNGEAIERPIQIGVR
jgi:hypothetical protein